MRRGLALGVLAAGLGTVLAGAVADARLAPTVRSGGTFRVVLCGGACFDSIDPALAFTIGGTAIRDTTCASLVRYPDRAPPAGYRLVPELAVDFPRISHEGRLYTFRIRKGVRYSTGALVTGHDFEHALERILDPSVRSPLVLEQALFTGITGAEDVVAGRARTVSGVTATRTTITFRLTQANGVFLSQLANLCAVPSDLPPDPEGARAPLPSAGPFYVSEYVLGRRIVLRRNPHYHGSRPHHIGRFEVDLEGGTLDTIVDQVKDGNADWTALSPNALGPFAADLAKRYGVNKKQFFVRRGLALRLFVLNTSRPLFRGNAPLRRAVNFAVERAALSQQRGPYTGTPIDHYLSSDVPGFRRVRIYPLVHPNLPQARALARGHTREGKAVVYVPNNPAVGPAALAQAQILQRDLGTIGLDLTIRQFPTSILFQKVQTPGEPFDLAWAGWFFSPDPWLLDCLFNGRWLGNKAGCNWSWFNSSHYNRLLNAANRLTGTGRSRAFARLDLELARDAAPAIPYAYDNALTLVSSRTGCIVLNPTLDLAAVCLKS
jgi:peptide/nickel transport system substrate-binding protein